VFNEISNRVTSMRKIELYKLTCKCFMDHMQAFPAKQYVQDTLLIFFNGKWPTAYTAHVKSLYDKGDCADKDVKFGKMVHEKYVAAKSFITSHLCFLYVPEHKLPPGKTLEQMLRALRKSCFPLEVSRNAKNAAKSKVARVKLTRLAAGLPFPQEEQDEMWCKHYVEARERLWQLFDENWYPDCWLLFLMFGLPAVDSRMILDFPWLGSSSCYRRSSDTCGASCPQCYIPLTASSF